MAHIGYNLNAGQGVRVFGLFKAKMRVEAQVNAEAGEVMNARVPWWATVSVKR